jgi:hypothetical protein
MGQEQLMTGRGQPDTPFTSLAKYVVSDRDRTRRAALLISVTTLAGTAAICAAATVLTFTGVIGVLVGIGGSVTGKLLAVHRGRRP